MLLKTRVSTIREVMLTSNSCTVLRLTSCDFLGKGSSAIASHG
jgi:hypothetical protein